MRTQLTVFLFLLTTVSAAAQFPVKTVNYYPSSAPAEIHFVDGNVGTYPVMRITKDLIRVDPGNNQSVRMPLTYLESIRFSDGCTMYFDKGQFQFDKLVQPAFLKNESGDVLLEGVLKLSKDQVKALMGPDTYTDYRKNNRILQIGLGSLAAGTMITIPYASSVVLRSFQGDTPVSTFKEMSSFWKSVTITGGCTFLVGVVLTIIGNNGCNRVIASYNDGLGVAYTF